MTALEERILNTLVELEKTISTMRTAQPKPSLQPLFRRLDDLTGQLPAGSDPQLLHYLHKKSYEKARLLLEEREAENARGSCRR